MLLKDFYTVDELVQSGDTSYVARITLNKGHAVFTGHFPDNPVTPGVCMIQIIKELAEEILSQKLLMTKASNVKFMALINPECHEELKLEIDIADNEEEGYKVKNVTYFDDTVALKLSATFKAK